MVTDKNGKELKVGDEVFVRAKVMAIPMDLEEQGLAILHVQWKSDSMPMLDYIKSNQVEKSEEAE